MEVGMDVTHEQMRRLRQAIDASEVMVPIVAPDKEALWARARAILGEEKYLYARGAIEGGHTIALNLVRSQDPDSAVGTEEK